MMVMSGSSLGLDPSVSSVIAVQNAINRAAEARGISKRGPAGGFFTQANYDVLMAVAKSVLNDHKTLALLSLRTVQGLTAIASGKVPLDQFVDVSVEHGSTDTIEAMRLIIEHSDPNLRNKTISAGTKLVVAGAVVLAGVIYLAVR